MKKHIDTKLMASIRAMMDSPNAHEADTARRTYERLLEKHGIEADELDEPKWQWDRPFKYQTKFEERLIWQVVYKAVGIKCERTRRCRQLRKKRSLIFELSEEELDFGHVLYAIYRKALKYDFDLMFECFLQKHMIFGVSDEEAEDLPTERINEMAMMMFGLRHIDAPQRDTPRLNAGT